MSELKLPVASRHFPNFAPLFLAFSLTACTNGDPLGNSVETYARNVESCICRFLEVEEDNYSGLTYADFVKDCNLTVHNSNPARYEASLQSSPKIEDLRCPEDVEAWREEVAKVQSLRENNRKFFEEMRGKNPASDNSDELNQPIEETP